MPFALGLIGIIMLVAVVRDRQTELYDALRADFTGPDNFSRWAVALCLIACVGYVKPLRQVSNAFLGLLFVVIVLSNRGLFNKVTDQLKGLGQ